MNLLPGCRVAVAPKFHLEANWPERFGVGVGIEESDGVFFPRGPWRAPTTSELAVLVAGEPPSRSLPLLGAEAPPPTESAPDAVQLFQIPEHLRETWWGLLDEVAATGGPLRGFDVFAAQVNEFLAFKRLDAPANARMEAVVTAAGERSIRRSADGRPAGLAPTVAPWASWPIVNAAAVSRLWGIVNLGDEDTGVVLINLTLSNLATVLARRAPADAPKTVAELVRRFLSAFTDYPPVRVRLGPGEGCRLPPDGLILDGDPTGKAEPDMLLLISQEGPSE